MSTRSTPSPITTLLCAALLALAGASCSDDTAPAADHGVKDQAARDAGTDTAAKDTGTDSAAPDQQAADSAAPDAGATLTFTGTFIDYATSQAVAGVKVCVVEQKSVPCVTSDTAGKFTLPKAPAGQDITLSMTKTGYLTFHAAAGKNQLVTAYGMLMLDNTTVAGVAAALSTSVKSGKGHIVVTASGASGRMAGVSFSLTQSAGEGPYYLDSTGNPSSSRTSTSSEGVSFVFNLDPGTYDLSWTSPTGKTCTLNSGWAGTTAASAKVKVAAGAATTVTVTCK